MPGTFSSDDAPTIRIKRELWKSKKTGKKSLHSVARSNGRFIATRPWHTKKDTEKVKDIVVHIESFRETYKPSKPVQPSFTGFRKSGDYPDRYVYLLQARFDKEYRMFSMTSSELYTMDEDMKISLFAATRHAYGDSPIKLRLIRIYNSRTMDTEKMYVGQRFET